MDPSGQVDLIREVFRYTQAFQGNTFVLQIDDGVSEHSSASLMRDLVLLHRTGIRVVLVAGARQRIDDILERYGVSCQRVGGVRIATNEAIPFVRMGAFDAANRLMTALSGEGVNAVIGNWVRARSRGVIDGVDFQNAGRVDRIHVDMLRGVIAQGSIPILPCIGWNAAGRAYDISSRELAAELAMALGATKLFFLSVVDPLTTARYQLPGESVPTSVLPAEGEDLAGRGLVKAPVADLPENEPAPTEEGDPPPRRISRMNVEQADAFLALNELRRELAEDPGIELVQLAVRAAKRGVERVHIVDGRSDGVVLREIFSNLGVGTMVHANQYQSIRAMTRADVPDVYRLMQPLVQRGLLVPRTESDLVQNIDDYVVFETDGIVHGSGALHLYNEQQGEIAGLAVDAAYADFRIGQRIVQFLLEGARRAGLSEVFVLTTQASDWFEQLGFSPATVNDVPPEKRERYDYRRNSRILRYLVT
jgi:amino-acid N-acetyltransferase